MTPEYRTEGITIPVVGTLTVESALGIAADLRAAAAYYRYDEVEVLISSPGGDLAALDVILWELCDLRVTHGVRIRTRAQGDVASAGALLLALGDVGARAVSPSTRVLLHEPRVHLGAGGHAQPWTEGDLTAVAHALGVAASRVLTDLAAHVWAGAPARGGLALRLPGTEHETHVTSEADLRAVYAGLLRGERWLSAEQARGLGLVDRVRYPGPVIARPIPSLREPGRTP
jgi:ATP-dependent protease ClpP protease subunit